MAASCHLVIDIGGSWIKGVAVDPGEYRSLRNEGRLSSLLTHSRRLRHEGAKEGLEGFLDSLVAFSEGLGDRNSWRSAVISTAGIVAPDGSRVLKCSDHLAFLRDPSWAVRFRQAIGCPISLINDAEAFTLGAAELGYVPLAGTVCSLVIGTGLGCAVVRDGRWLRPDRSLPLLGSIRIPEGSYDSLASASRLAGHERDGDLVKCLREPEFEAVREVYWANLAKIATTAGILYGADKLLIGGGLCEAAGLAEVDLKAAISRHLAGPPPELDRVPEIAAVVEGNGAQMLGAAALACSSFAHQGERRVSVYGKLPTEQVHRESFDLHVKATSEILDLLWSSEQAAGLALEDALPVVAEVVEHVVDQWPLGGRIIYVGAGTSGRIAALDATEIPCTFGQPRDRVVAVIAGGLADACFTIESNGEEDFSSAADMILLNVGPADTVIGISASGTAFFVQSALAHARDRGARTALVKVGTQEPAEGWDWIISLNSGPEVVAGSTRMKAGTATKKIVNFLTTAAMVKCGKVHGPYMVDMLCLNEKLQVRATRILHALFQLTDVEANALLARHGFHLKTAIQEYDGRRLP